MYEKNVKTIHIRDSELEYGGLGGVTKSQAMRAHIAGYMQGARRQPSLYHRRGIHVLRFKCGKQVMRRRI